MDAVLRKVHDKIQHNFRRGGGGLKFFGTARRGENAELQEDLNSGDREREKKAVKRITAGMTLGRDVSHLFMDVVKLGQTANLELKKLVYLYVLNTAKLRPDKALMAVNTFLQDTTNSSPIVRALAVRTMLCLRVDAVVEYTLEPLRRAVSDHDPYVRKTAAIGIGKLFHYKMKIFTEQEFDKELLKLLNDVFPIVSCNAAAVLAEVNSHLPVQIVLSSQHISRLLNHLPDCMEWGQLSILELIADVCPSDRETAEDIVGRVLPRLCHSNSSIVMAAIKVIANLSSQCSAEAVSQYSARVNSALVTLAKGDPETQYVVCKNINALLVIFPKLFSENIDSFYVRFTDPPYVKLEKLRLLLRLVSPSTAFHVVKELEEYSSEIDLFFVKEVVQSIAMLALKIEPVASICVQLLLRIVGKRPELLPQVITSCNSIVRKYPEQLVLDTLISEHGADAVAEEDAKVSLIWMLGEFCDFVEDGKSIITRFIDGLMSHEQSVQLAILSAVIKMFLRDPAGMEQTLNKVLEILTTESNEPDLRDRAYAYWRLLSRGVGVAKMKQIVHGHRSLVAVEPAFSDLMTLADLKKSINTAAAVFGKPAHVFLPQYGITNNDAMGDEDEDEDEEEIGAEEERGDNKNNNSNNNNNSSSNNNDEEKGEQSSVGKNNNATLQANTSHLSSSSVSANVHNQVMFAEKFPAKHHDPLDDLFGVPPVASATTLREQTKEQHDNKRCLQQSSLLDCIDTFSDKPQNLPPKHHLGPTEQKPPFPPLVLPAGNTGVAVHCQLIEGPALWLGLVSHREVPIDQLVLQVNHNVLGYLPAASLSNYIQLLPPGGTVAVELPLKASSRHFDATRQVLEVGIKGQNLPLSVFRVKIQADKFFARPEAVEKAAFVSQWQTLGEGSEFKQALGDVAEIMLKSSDRRDILERHGFFLLTPERDSGCFVSIYGAVTTTLGLRGLVEIVLDKGNPPQSHVSLRSDNGSFIMSLVISVIQAAFLIGEKTDAVAVKTAKGASVSLDELFL